MDPADNKIQGMLVSLLLVAIGLTIALTLIVGYLSIKIDNDNYCGMTKIRNFTTNSLANSSFLLDHPGSYVTQPFPLVENDNLYFEFCYDLIFSGTGGAHITIRNVNESIAHDYVYTGKTHYCTQLDPDKIMENNYLGVECETCTANNNITLLHQSLGQTVPHVQGNATSTTVTSTNSLSYALYGLRDCRHYVQFFSALYYLSVSFIALMFLLLIGFKSLKKKFLEIDLK